MTPLKTILPKSVLTLLLLTVTLISCSSDDDPLTPDLSDYTLTAIVDGVDFSRDNAIVGTAPDDVDIYIITAIGETSISIALSSPLSEGTFSTSVDEEAILIYQTSDNIDGWWLANDGVGSGTVTISKNNDSYIEGTFSFTAFNGLSNTTKEITEGKFKAQKI